MVGGTDALLQRHTPAMMTPSLIEELEGALAAGTNAQRIAMLARVTDLFVEGAGN